MEIDHLSLTMSGRWVVNTETSAYLLDFENRSAVRLPGLGHGSLEGLPPAEVADLRRDEEAVTLIDVIACEVGSRMTLALAEVSSEPGVVTIRQTTIVRSIEAV